MSGNSGGNRPRGHRGRGRRSGKDRWYGFRNWNGGWWNDNPNDWSYGSYWNWYAGYGYPGYNGYWGFNFGFGLCYDWYRWCWYSSFNNWSYYPRYWYLGYAALPALCYYNAYPSAYADTVYIYDDSPDVVFYDDDDDVDIYIEGGADVHVDEEEALEEEPPAEAPAAAASLPAEPASLAEKYLKLGDLYFKVAKYSQAADAYARAIELAPDEAALHFILADALFGSGDYHFAAFAIRRGLEKDPSLAASHADKHRFYADPSLLDGQIKRLEHFLVESPKDGDAWLVLGYNRYFTNDLTGARKALLHAQEILGTDAAAQRFLDSIDKRLASGSGEKGEAQAPAHKID